MSSLCMKVFELNQLASDKLLYTQFILRFNSKSQRFEISKITDKSLIPFHFTWSFLTLLIWPILNIYILIYKGIFNSNTLKKKYFFFCLATTPPMLQCNGINLALIAKGEELITYINYLMELQKKFVGKSRAKKDDSLRRLVHNEWRKLWSKNTRKDVDLVGLAVITLVLSLAATPFIYSPGPFLTRIDPFSYCTQEIFQYETRYPLWMQIQFRIAAAICAILCCMEAIRTPRIVYLTLIVVTKISLDLVKRIKQISKTDLSRAIDMYKIMYAIHVKMLRSGSGLIFVSVKTAILMAIMSLTGTLLGWKFIPLAVYWLNPMMAIMSLLIAAMCMNFATKCADISIIMIRDWKYRVMECKRGSRKLNYLVVKSLQPMAFRMNALGYLLPETKMRMFRSIFENTVDTVLLSIGFINSAAA